jgi:predicted ATPase
VHAVIAQRLARLSPEARELTRLAATVGRACTSEVLAEASDLEEDDLVRGLDELWRRRILREHDGDAYDFSHDKLREVAYGEISPARRRQLHGRVAEALLACRSSAVDVVASQLAAHYELAGAKEEAIRFYGHAADVAQRSYADEEAIRHLRRALHLLAEISPSRSRDGQEAALLTALGHSLTAARGWAAPETGRAYERAVTLGEQAGDPTHRFAALWGLWAFHAVRGELRKARQTSERLVRHAEAQDMEVLASARLTLAISLFHLGELEQAAELLGQEAPREHLHDLLGPVQGALSLSYQSYVLWHLGLPDQALVRSREALQLSEEVAHPFSQAIALAF